MRLISLSTLTLTIIMLSCDTPGNVDPVFENYYTKYYGVDGEQTGVDLVLNNDGSMVLLGNSFSQTDPISPFIVKTDAQGNVLWQREFKNDNETAVDIQVINGGANVAVLTNVQRATTNICVYILAQDGNVVDSLYLTSTGNQVGRSIAQSSDNGFLIAGYKDPDPDRNDVVEPPTDQADMLLLKINNALTEVKDWSPGGGEYIGSGVAAFEVTFNNSPYYLLFGYSDRPRKGTTVYQSCFQLTASNVDGVPTGMHEFSKDVSEEQVASSTLKIPAAGQYLLTITGNFRLAGTSCIDKGSYAEFPEDILDINQDGIGFKVAGQAWERVPVDVGGNRRSFGSAPDLGAYEGFAGHWPNAGEEEQVVAQPLNTKPKYVASRTLTEPLGWQNSTVLEGYVAEAVAALKQEDGGDLLVIGSTELVQTLVEHGLVGDVDQVPDGEGVAAGA